jgi:ArsR family transcriptional regulator
VIARIEEPLHPTNDPAVFELMPRVSADLAQFFKLFADETRLRILTYLADERELSVTDLCNKLGHSQPAVSHHLALMRAAGLIHLRREGKFNFYSVRSTSMLQDVVRFLDVIDGQGKVTCAAPEATKEQPQISDVPQVEVRVVDAVDQACFNQIPTVPAVPAA